MKLESQVCTLEQAKRLQELGVTQVSIWFWETLKHFPDCAENRLTAWFNAGHSISQDVVTGIFSAFTVAELGVMLGGALTLNPVLVESRGEAFDRADELIHLLECGELSAFLCSDRLEA